MSMLSEISAFLVANGITGTIFEGRIDEDPANVVGLYDLAGAPDEYVFGQADPAFTHPRLQVLVRDEAYATGWAKIGAIHTLLTDVSKVVNRTLSGVKYYDMASETPPYKLDEDENGRHLFLASYAVTKDPS
jgi:hypothetical protein